MNRVPRCRLPPTPGRSTKLVAAASALEHRKLRQLLSPSCCPTGWTPAAASARTSASLGPASHQTPFQSGKSILLLLSWWLVQDPGIREPGWAWVELELSCSTTTPAAPFSTPGDICRDPYRPGNIVVVLFCLRPINYPAPPPRHRPMLSRRLCVTYTHTPSSPGEIHPSVRRYQPRPVFTIVYKSWLDHTCLTFPTTYVFPYRAAYIRTASYHQLPSAKDRRPPALHTLYLSLSLSSSPSWLHLLSYRLPVRTGLSSPSNSSPALTVFNSFTTTYIHKHPLTHPRMCDFTKNYYIYSSCLDPGAHFFRTSVDGNRKLACPKGPHERYIVQPGTCPLCSG